MNAEKEWISIHFQFSLSCIHDIDYFVSLKLDISNEIETARYTTKHKFYYLGYKLLEELIIITSTFRSLDTCRSEPFLRLIPLNLSDHQKGIYALRCLVFLVYLIAATSQWSSLLWWIAITNLLLYPISLNDSQVALCFLISNPPMAWQTSHH